VRRRFRLLLALSSLAAAGVLFGCSGDDTVVELPPPTDPAWRWMNPASEGVTLSDVWGPSANNLFATGQQGVVLRYNGTAWRVTQTPTTANLTAVWGTSATNIIAVGTGGVVLRFDGTTWTNGSPNPAVVFLDVWGSAPNDIFVVGIESAVTRRVYHYDGSSWAPMTVPPGLESLTSVWGSGPGDVYATGLGTSFLHYDGVSWNSLATPATFALTEVWGTSASDVFAVGGNGAAIHFDGADWSPIDVGAPAFLEAVWGTASSDVYAMGLAGSAYHWDGLAWSPIVLHSVKSVYRIFGVGGVVWAVGEAGTIHEHSGGGWQPANGGMTRDMKDVWTTPDGQEAFAVGGFGTIFRFRAGSWAESPSGTLESLRSVSGTSAGDVIAVGENGAALHFDGAAWNNISTFPIHLNEVWMDAPGTAYAVGEQGTILRFDGAQWVDASILGVTERLLGVWGPAANDFWVTGANSTAFRWNGTGWKLINIDLYNVHNFHDVHGTGPNDVYVASEYLQPRLAAVAGDTEGAYTGPLHAGGLIFHWDGLQWTPVYQDPVHDVLGVWRANAERGFACGDAASILAGDTAATPEWRRVQDLSNLPFLVTAVWGSSSANVFIVGDNGAVARYSR